MVTVWRRRVTVCGFLVAFSCAVVTSHVSGDDPPDCDGSTPESKMCGTETTCEDPEQIPGSAEWHCPNDAIVKQFIQYECKDGAGTGSTLCGPAEDAPPLVCTKRYECELAELEDPETGEIISRSCAQPLTGGANNSTATKTDYIECSDTSG